MGRWQSRADHLRILAQRSDYQPTSTVPMSYMEDMDQWLTELLKDLPASKLENVKKQIKDKLWLSYRNGLKSNGRKSDKQTTA